MFKRILASRYQLIKIIGKGAFGKTYLAQDVALPGTPKCVVKKLNPTIKDNGILEIARRLFVTEAESLQKLGEHPQIPRFLASFEEKNNFYLVQEYIEGHTLSEEIGSHRIWSEQEVIELLRDCLNILEFIHSQKVIHRDIKPNNLIRRREDNRLVLVDFGAVKEAISQSKIASTIAIGTQGYMPSEQARGKPRFSSDIYALGIIAIEALTGFSAVNFSENDKGEIVWYGQENINPKLVKIVNKMTRYHFKDRYRSASQVLKDLNALDLSCQEKKENIIDRLSALLKGEKKDEETAIYPGFALQDNVVKTERNSNYYGKQKVATTLIKKSGKENIFNALKLKFPGKLGIGSIATLAIVVLGGAGFGHHQKQQQIVSMIDLMGGYYEREEYDLCLQNASIKARQIGVPTERIDFFIGKCALGAAEKEAENKNYSKAIALAREIPENNPFNPQAQENINKWSQILLARATEIYKKEGNLQEAKAIITNIPPASTVGEKARKLTNEWQEEIAKSEEILANADKAITAKKWQEAIDEANKIKTVNNSIYWQEKANKIVTEARESQEKELAAARARQLQQQRAIQQQRRTVYNRQAPVRRYNNYRRPTYQAPVVRQRTVTYPRTTTNRSGYRVRRRTVIRRERIVRTRTCRGACR